LKTVRCVGRVKQVTHSGDFATLTRTLVVIRLAFCRIYAVPNDLGSISVKVHADHKTSLLKREKARGVTPLACFPTLSDRPRLLPFSQFESRQGIHKQLPDEVLLGSLPLPR